MNPRLLNKRNQAMDIVDLLVLIAIIAILATMIILSVRRMHSRAHSAANLKQAKLSYHILEGGYDNRFPMTVSAATPPEFRNGTMNVNSPSRFP